VRCSRAVPSRRKGSAKINERRNGEGGEDDDEDDVGRRTTNESIEGAVDRVQGGGGEKGLDVGA
jgi:hypothetical protein